MHQGKLVFAQLKFYLPLSTFRRCVADHRGEHKVKDFSCLDQFFAMAFAQLTYRESLLDVEVNLRAQARRLYHMGIRCQTISRNTLANANATRPWQIYADFAQHLIGLERPRTTTMRRVVVKDDRGKRLVFLTNNFPLKPELIGDLYRQRWQVELFFKWNKQHLRIKVFFGTRENAVKTQIWIAISTYLLIAIAKKRLHLDHHSPYEILQVLSLSMFETIPINQLLTPPSADLDPDFEPNQLTLL
jgi:hypothetical protein